MSQSLIKYMLFLSGIGYTVGMDYTTIGEEELKIDDGSSSEPSDDSSNDSGGNSTEGGSSGGSSGGTTGGSSGGTTGGSSGGTGGSSGGTTGGSSGGTTGGNPGTTTGGTGGQPTSIIVSSFWEGDLTRSSGSYYGEESYDLNDGSYPVNQFNCQLVWDLVAQDDTSSNCVGCTFQVKVQATPQSGPHIVNDGTCTGDFIATTFGYGLTSFQDMKGVLL